jgi:hypothetical protein
MDDEVLHYLSISIHRIKNNVKCISYISELEMKLEKNPHETSELDVAPTDVRGLVDGTSYFQQLSTAHWI